MYKSFCKVTSFFFSFILMMSVLIVLADETRADETGYKFYLGEKVNAGKDTGYSEKRKIEQGDPHYGWNIGEFFVSGYSSKAEDNDNNPIFLKNVGDKVVLWFILEQDLNKLGGNNKYSVCDDTNGYDEYFGIEKTNFGKGALIVRHKNSENQWSEPVIYTNFLEAKSKDAYTQVEIFEEGDYEVALDYEIKENNLNIFGWKPMPSYYNYRIFFRFSVRNGNCMVYPFDVTTGAELTNSSFTQNGFYLDFANSKYLNINIKKEVLNEGSEGLIEDVRFNRPAKDGERYTEEGVYTITVTNEYTKQETVKKIYVGTNDVLKAHVATGFSIEEINHQIALGATVGKNGELVSVSNQQTSSEVMENNDSSIVQKTQVDYIVYIIMAVVGFVVLVIIICAIIRKKRKAYVKAEGDTEK